MSDEFKEELHKQKSSKIKYWKKKFGYSSSDERYLNATMSQINEDLLEDLCEKFDDILKDKVLEENLKNEATIPDYKEKKLKSFKNSLIEAITKAQTDYE